MKHAILNFVLLASVVWISFGCASARPYFAPTVEEIERSRAEAQAAQKNEAENALTEVGGLFGTILPFTGLLH